MAFNVVSLYFHSFLKNDLHSRWPIHIEMWHQTPIEIWAALFLFNVIENGENGCWTRKGTADEPIKTAGRPCQRSSLF